MKVYDGSQKGGIMRLLTITGWLLRIVAVAGAGIAVAWGLYLPKFYADYARAMLSGGITVDTPDTAVLRTAFIVGGLLGGLFCFALGGLCCGVAVSAAANQRSAVALEALAGRRKSSP